MGADGFGCQIMLHAPKRDENLAVGRISNVEVTYAGQAFRLGRYAIHFHLNGDMSESYVKNTAIHHSFNRAVNVHGTHNVLIQSNVAYDIMGGAFFLEDGVETGNIFEYNLAVMVKQSTSLQNDDITPAGFWITNPNNTVRHNTAVGGTHFGFWYRMHQHPDGPSFDPNICPRNVPLGIFSDNHVHSQGWFGLWIFQKYTPKKGGFCDAEEDEIAVFEKFTAWNCEKGAEWVDGGALRFSEFLVVNNEVAGLELKLSGGPKYSGAMIKDSTIVAKPSTSGILEGSSTKLGIIMPYSSGFSVTQITFVNFEDPDKATFGVTEIQGLAIDNAGGFSYR